MKRTTFSIFMGSVVFSVLFLLASCATFKGEIPMEGTIPEEVYISPINQDGIQDTLVLPVTIPDLKGLKIAGYQISVLSETSDEVYSLLEGIPVSKQKGSSKKPTLILPKEIIWDGRDNDGLWVNDGVYTMNISAWDYSGNSGALDPILIIVDNTPPVAESTLPYLVFSPNGDGKQDFLDLFQTSSSEDLWEGVFEDKNGKSVRTFSWPGLAPDFQWNGLDNSDSSLAEGSYVYRLSSTDRAGNSFSKETREIVIDKGAFSISISADVPAFSPNGNGVLDMVSFRLEADSEKKIMDARLDIVGEAGMVQRKLDLVLGPKTFPQVINFDGKDGKNNSGRVLPEGNYYGKFTVLYENGDNPVVTSSSVLLDITLPRAVLSLNMNVFSPDGDGRKDEITINQSTSIEKSWEGTFTSIKGDVVASRIWKDRAVTFAWDGKDNSGVTVPDGEYVYSIKSTDLAGNQASYQLRKFAVDTRPTPVKVTNRLQAFSPNNDGIDDILEFDLKPTVTDGITGWNFMVTDTTGALIYQFNGQDQSSVPSSISWNGTDTDGKIAEGKFQGKLDVDYEKGNIGTASIMTPFVLDLSPPRVSSSITPVPFSPDGDGENDVLNIKISVSDNVAVKNWNAIIKDPTGQTFLNLPSSRFLNGEFKWDGKSARGELVQSASDYTLVVTAVDTVGNSVTTKGDVIPVDILVIRDGDRLKISISSIYFKPNTADYRNVEPALVEKNLSTLDRLAVILNKYSGYKIGLEGHAVRVYWDKADRWQQEESEVLGPLSKERAETIRDALVTRGVAGKRMTTSGMGGYQPVVPHGDLTNRWKNRRVEFILIK